VNEFPSWLEWLPDGMESWEALVAIATILVALATGGLASATFVLARQTKNDVGASTRTAAVAERSFATSIRPILVNFVESGEPRVRKHGQHDRLEVSVPLRNVGGGLALLLGPSIEVASSGYTRLVERADVSAIPAGGEATFVFELECENQATRAALQQEINQRGFHVTARYRDLDGGQLGRTRARSDHLPSIGWRVTGIELFRDDEAEPFAVLPGRSISINLADSINVTDEAFVGENDS